MKPAIRRPKSLEEVAIESGTYQEFGYNTKDFLHEFNEARRGAASVAPMLAAAPPRLAERFKEGNICDAFLAGTADYLSRVSHIPTPVWALAEDLVLEQPWFSVETLGVRGLLLRDTPSAFKDKNIFIFASSFETG